MRILLTYLLHLLDNLTRNHQIFFVIDKARAWCDGKCR